MMIIIITIMTIRYPLPGSRSSLQLIPQRKHVLRLWCSGRSLWVNGPSPEHLLLPLLPCLLSSPSLFLHSISSALMFSPLLPLRLIWPPPSSLLHLFSFPLPTLPSRLFFSLLPSMLSPSFPLSVFASGLLFLSFSSLLLPSPHSPSSCQVFSPLLLFLLSSSRLYHYPPLCIFFRPLILSLTLSCLFPLLTLFLSFSSSFLLTTYSSYHSISCPLVFLSLLLSYSSLPFWYCRSAFSFFIFFPFPFFSISLIIMICYQYDFLIIIISLL